MKIESKIIQKFSIFFNFKSEFCIKKQNYYAQNFQDTPGKTREPLSFSQFRLENSEKKFCYEKK